MAIGADRALRVVHLSRPVPGRGEVLVDVACSGICGSDLPRWLADLASGATEQVKVLLRP